MRFEKEMEIGIHGCLTPDFIKYDFFSQDYTWTVLYEGSNVSVFPSGD
jgi:hypothetical protein